MYQELGSKLHSRINFRPVTVMIRGYFRFQSLCQFDPFSDNGDRYKCMIVKTEKDRNLVSNSDNHQGWVII